MGERREIDRGQEDTVRIACREPGSPNSVLVDQPWQVALVDSPSALSWQQPDAERPLWIVNVAKLAAQSGIPDLDRFTVVAGFRPDQLAKRKYVILYRSMTEGKRSAYGVQARPVAGSRELALARMRSLACTVRTQVYG